MIGYKQHTLSHARTHPTTTHHHLLCIHCGRLEDLFRQFANLNLSPEESQGFVIINHQVISEGLCPDCQLAEIEESDAEGTPGRYNAARFD